MTIPTTAAVLAAALMAGLSAPALAQEAPMSPRPEAAAQARFEQDRQSILAMAGDYRVRFEFDETTPFLEGYEPREPTRSGGHEIVRVIADTGTFISLQHTLVAEHGGEVMIIKHWRQDWTYQPETVLTYTGPDSWALAPVAEADRTGAWSQTVWQTDDSPRYGGVGRWDYSNGVASWEARTWRPLARRDATRSPPYDRYDAMNRHVLTPTGWVHEQDNFKVRQARMAWKPWSMSSGSIPTLALTTTMSPPATPIGPPPPTTGPSCAAGGTRPSSPAPVRSMSMRRPSGVRKSPRP